MKANRFTLFVLLLTMASLAGCAVLGAGSGASAASAPRTITVQGHGDASGSTDMATVNVGISIANTDISQAVQGSNQVIADLTSALQALSIDPVDIQTTGFNIWPEDVYDPNTGQPTGTKRYHVDSSLQVNIRNIDSVGKVLETSINKGANNVYGLSFGIQDVDSLASAARAAALADARQRAEEMAQVLGVSLGEVTTVSDLTSSPAFPYFASAGMGLGGGGDGVGQPPISEGQMTISASVSVSYEILK